MNLFNERDEEDVSDSAADARSTSSVSPLSTTTSNAASNATNIAAMPRATHRSMTLSVPDCPEIRRAKLMRRQRMNRCDAMSSEDDGGGGGTVGVDSRKCSLDEHCLLMRGGSTKASSSFAEEDDEDLPPSSPNPSIATSSAGRQQHNGGCMFPLSLMPSSTVSTPRRGPMRSPAGRKMSLMADAFSESIKTFAITGIGGSSYRKGRKMKKSRLVLKNGICNVYSTNVSKKDRQYLRDIFTTLIDVKWRYILLTFACVFLTSWLLFAIIYYAICWIHGDFQLHPATTTAAKDASPTGDRLNNVTLLTSDNQYTDNQYTDANDAHCVVEIRNFLSAFLFSLETQHTIGYGFRHITDQCITAVVTVCMQSICGILLQSIMVGLVFAKLTRPKKRAETLIFSEKAVISLRDGNLCCLVRVGDMRSTHLVEAHVRMQLIQQRVTEEGEVEPLHQYELKVGETEGDDRIFLVWPIILCHIIDENSPLANYCAKDIPSAQFELVVILEGIVESTGMTAQARSSYLPSEVLWGHRFEKLVTYQRDNGQYKIDYSLFQKTYSVKTPRCSAKEFYRMKKAGLRTGDPDFYFCKNETEAGMEELSRSSIECCTTPLPSPRPFGDSSAVSSTRASLLSLAPTGSQRRRISSPVGGQLTNCFNAHDGPVIMQRPQKLSSPIVPLNYNNSSPPAIIVDSPPAVSSASSPNDPEAMILRKLTTHSSDEDDDEREGDDKGEHETRTPGGVTLYRALTGGNMSSGPSSNFAPSLACSILSELSELSDEDLSKTMLPSRNGDIGRDRTKKTHDTTSRMTKV